MVLCLIGRGLGRPLCTSLVYKSAGEYPINIKELREINSLKWCCRRDLNSRPLPYQGSALPLSYGSAVRHVSSIKHTMPEKRGGTVLRGAEPDLKQAFRSRSAPLTGMGWLVPQVPRGRKPGGRKNSARANACYRGVPANLHSPAKRPVSQDRFLFRQCKRRLWIVRGGADWWRTYPCAARQ